MTDNHEPPSLEDLFGPVIFRYTRADAIRDGVLVDLMQSPTAEEPEADDLGALVRQAGFTVPIAMTATAWDKAVCPLDGELPEGQDIQGRLWDILTVLRLAIAARQANGPELGFRVNVWDGRRSHLVELKCHSGPGDQGEHVLTIMLPNED